jgi:YbbR domain-containing protein
VEGSGSVVIGLLTKNLGWKLLALSLALLLWIALVRDPELATTVTAPVLFRGMPQELELSGELVQRVQLEIRGPQSQLNPEDLTDAAVVLQLGNVDRPGDRTYTIEPSNVSLPTGVLFARAVPAQIRLHFERRISRKVPVRIRITDPPPDGYRVVSQSVEPGTLAIVGPQSNVEQISFVDTDSIDLSNTYGPAEFPVNTFVGNPQVRFEDNARVIVHVVVERIARQ